MPGIRQRVGEICCQRCPKCGLDWSKSHDWWCSAVYNSVSKGGEVFLHFTLLHVACILPQKFARTHVPWLCSKVMSKSTETLPAKIQRTVYW